MSKFYSKSMKYRNSRNFISQYEKGFDGQCYQSSANYEFQIQHVLAKSKNM